MHDPMDGVTPYTIKEPPNRGPGSGKAAWVRYALELLDANRGWQETVEEQSTAIRELKAEIALLKRQIATRKPKGARPPVPQETVDRIEYEVARGGSTRHIARLYHVSHVTVHRIRQHMAERERLAAGAG
jgi:hypothetical protein